MGRKQHHEEHVNHEAWAIPYGDLITLLLAFFVVMYAVSSVNEGKYRVLSNSLQAAFRGSPKTLSPVQIGDNPAMQQQSGSMAGFDPSQGMKTADEAGKKEDGDGEDSAGGKDSEGGGSAGGEKGADNGTETLNAMAEQMESVLDPLIQQDMIAIHRDGLWVEVEIKTDILFPSGKAEIQDEAIAILTDVGEVLKPLDNTIRIEGHTDDRPINTARFPSNWELSAARAARIVRQFEQTGIDSSRMVVAGMGEHQPVASNATPEGRNQNRRVTLVVLNSVGDGTAAARERTSVAANTVTEPDINVESDSELMDSEEQSSPPGEEVRR